MQLLVKLGRLPKEVSEDKKTNFKIEFAKIHTSRVYSTKQSFKISPHEEFSHFELSEILPLEAKIKQCCYGANIVAVLT